jgi:hypothetical protein
VVSDGAAAASLSDLRVRDETSEVAAEPLDIPSEISTANNNKKPIPTHMKSMSTPSVTGRNRPRLRYLHHVQGVTAEHLFPSLEKS